jgi:hypothetical protein
MPCNAVGSTAGRATGDQFPAQLHRRSKIRVRCRQIGDRGRLDGFGGCHYPASSSTVDRCRQCAHHPPATVDPSAAAVSDKTSVNPVLTIDL